MRIIHILFILCWIVADVLCKEFCPTGSEPVVQICQRNKAVDIDEVYVNSGGVPRLQIVEDCMCSIQPMKTNNLRLDIELVSRDNLKEDMKFYVNRADLTETGTFRSAGKLFELRYSKLDETSDGGGCVKLKSDSEDDKFNITCEAKTLDTTITTARPSTMSLSGPSNESDNTVVIGAVIGSLLFVSLIIVIVVIVIVKKRRRSREQKNTNQSGNENIEKEYDETYDEYGMQLNPSYESSDGIANNQTGKTSSLYEHHYAVADDQRNSNEVKSTDYAYAECRLPSSNPTTNKNVQNQNEDTYDHTTTTTSAGSKNETQNVYNHLSPSFSQLQSDVDEYNTVGTVNINKIQTISDNDYNVLNLS
ncbi:hypothetical protein ACF0H5_007184 [Mactra antiquata]